jgi:hypothetical protein
VEKPDATLKALGKSGRFETLDMKLANALQPLMQGEAGREATRISEEYAKKDKWVTGRQILWILYKYYRINQEAESFYQLTDLVNCRS